jgi:biotin transport system substrate-specific component
MENAGTVRTDKRMKTLDLVYIAIGAALITVCSWISIPTTIPFTLQTFAIFSVLLILGGERGTVATLVYVLMGAVGIPVFSGFTGGFGILMGNTGGYIIGFIFIGLIYSVSVKLFGEKIRVKIPALLAGLLVCYAFGTAWFMYVYMRNTGAVGLMTVLSWCVFPFIIPDLAKMAIAFIISRRVRSVIK